jgi:hypothetical protein
MDAAQQMMRKFHALNASREEGRKALWAMSAEQRVSAMRRGELVWWQLYEWAARAGHEVPLLDGEFEFIAIHTPEVADLRETERR